VTDPFLNVILGGNDLTALFALL